jgi:hypothetical protein
VVIQWVPLALHLVKLHLHLESVSPAGPERCQPRGVQLHIFLAIQAPLLTPICSRKTMLQTRDTRTRADMADTCTHIGLVALPWVMPFFRRSSVAELPLRPAIRWWRDDATSALLGPLGTYVVSSDLRFHVIEATSC